MTPEQFQLHAKIEDSHCWFVGRRHIVEKIINASVPDKKQKILVDLGCGTGGNIGIFQDKFDCIGLDISEHAIDIARKRFPNITFISGGAEGTIYPIIEKADMVLLLDVLEHIENDSLFLKNLVTHMPSGSHLLVTAPANMCLWSPHDESHGHFRRYTRRQLQGVFAELPVSVKLLSYYNSFLYPVVKGVRVFTKFRGKTWGEACTDLSMPARPINFLLTELFAAESRLLLRRMDQPHRTSLPFGVSVIALLRKV